MQKPTNILWTSSEVAEATGGKSDNTKEWLATGVSIDSRTIKSGDLFIAIKGEKFDGHKFVKQALAKGAVAAVVNEVPDDVSDDSSLLIVDDTTEALVNLGKFSRKRTRARIIGITGSVGKTSTKDMAMLACIEAGRTYATEGNLNNHYGVPLTLSRIPKDTDFVIIEMGMNHKGEIADLTHIAVPEIAVITTIDAVHLEFFSGIEAIAEAKAEIFESMQPGNSAVLNVDNAQFAILKAIAEAKDLKIITFGESENADFRLTEYEETQDGCKVVAVIGRENISYAMKLRGRHFALNSVCAIAAAAASGISLEDAVSGVAKFESVKGRGEVHTVKLPQGGEVMLIDDSYNASPASVAAALAVLAGRRNADGRIIAILGDMLELGKKSGELHANLVKEIMANNVDLVFTAGELMQHLYNELPKQKQGDCCENSEELAKLITSNIRAGDVILVKGSNGSKMNKVVNTILELGK